MVDFLEQQRTQNKISNFCAAEHINWRFIPERVPHFGGLWEAAIKSMKQHLRRTMGEKKLTFEECTTLLTQIESCLNSRPLVPLPTQGDQEALTPGHFLIGKALESLPNPFSSSQHLSTLRRWHLVQAMVCQFWHKWSAEYLVAIRKLTKWHQPKPGIC